MNHLAGAWRSYSAFILVLVSAAMSNQQTAKAQSSEQQAPPAATLKLKTQLVVLDISVTDSHGGAVTTLKQDDFQIYDSGIPQRIRSFEAPSAHTLPPSLTATSAVGITDLQRVAPEAPVTLLLMDELNTAFTDQAFSRTALERYLAAQPEVLLQPTSLLAVTENKVIQINDFTLNRQTLDIAMKNHKPAYPFQLMRTGNAGEGTLERFAESLATLQQIAQALSGYRGRKNIVWVGPGFPSIDMRDLPETQRSSLRGVSERTINLLRDSHVTLYTIDPRMMSSTLTNPDQSTDSPSLSETHNARNPFDGTISFNTFAPETGGRSFALGNDLDKQIQASVQDGTSFYTIAYTPSIEVGKSASDYKTLNVRVKQPGLLVNMRQGYFSAPPSLPVATPEKEKKAVSFDLGTAATSRIAYSGVSLFAQTLETGKFVLQINTSSITWQTEAAGDNRSDLIILVVALDKSDKPLNRTASTVSARLPAERELTSVPYVTVPTQLALPEKTTRIRFIVRDVATGKIGSFEVLPAIAEPQLKR